MIMAVPRFVRDGHYYHLDVPLSLRLPEPVRDETGNGGTKIEPP